VKLFKIIKREYLDRVRRKSFFIGTILGPVFMGAMIIIPGLLMQMSSDEQVRMAVLDRSGSVFESLREALGDTLKDGRKMFILSRVEHQGNDIESTKEFLKREVEEDVIDGYLVIPEDVVDTGEVTYYGRKVSNFTTLEMVESAINEAVLQMRLSRAGMDYGFVKKMMKKVRLETIQIKKGEEKKSEFENLFQTSFVFIMILYMTILMWGVAVQRSIIDEKNNRIIEVLLSSVRPFDILVGKIVGIGAVGLTQYAIWAGFAGFLALYAVSAGFGQFISFSASTIVFFVVYYLLGFLFYSSIFAGIGAICNSDQEAQQLQTPVVMALAFTIVIPIAVIQNPEGLFATVVSLIPFFTPIVMFMRISVLTPPAWQIALSIVIMLISIYAAGLISAKVFRIGILMYGKRPQIREVMKWVRRA